MENSFKKTYTTTTQSDGSVLLSFKTQRFGASAAAAVGLIFTLILFPASCAATLPILYLFGFDIMKNKISGVFFWNVLSMALFYVLLKLSSQRTSVIKIITKQGLEFDGHHLPFKDIQRLEVIPVENNPSMAYIAADTQGQTIHITKPMPLALAQALNTELFEYRAHIK